MNVYLLNHYVWNKVLKRHCWRQHGPGFICRDVEAKVFTTIPDGGEECTLHLRVFYLYFTCICYKSSLKIYLWTLIKIKLYPTIRATLALKTTHRINFVLFDECWINLARAIHLVYVRLLLMCYFPSCSLVFLSPLYDACNILSTGCR